MWLYSTDRHTYTCTLGITPIPGGTNIEYLTMMGGTLVGVKSEITMMEYVITHIREYLNGEIIFQCILKFGCQYHTCTVS